MTSYIFSEPRSRAAHFRPTF